MANNWDILWKDSEKTKRWSVPDKHFVRFIKDENRTSDFKKALDIGCGIGRHTIALVRKGFRVVAIDNSEVCFEYIKENYANEISEIEKYCRDFRDLEDFADNSMDLIVS